MNVRLEGGPLDGQRHEMPAVEETAYFPVDGGHLVYRRDGLRDPVATFRRLRVPPARREGGKARRGR